MGEKETPGHQELHEGRVSNAFGEGEEMSKEELARATRSQHGKRLGKRPDGSIDGDPPRKTPEKPGERR